MAYVKNIWKDRIVQYPRRYTDELGNVKTFIPNEGTITETGTPITSGAMNKIENELVALDAPARDARGEGIKTPQWYIDNGHINKLVLELNTYVNVGLSGTTLCHVQTSIPWSDTSAGVVQTITDPVGNRYQRYAISPTTWSATQVIPTTMASVIEYVPPDTVSHTLLTYTPIVTGCFELKSYLRWGNCNCTLTLSWTDAQAAQTLNILDNFFVDAASHPVQPVFFYAQAGYPITLTAQISALGSLAFTHKLISN